MTVAERPMRADARRNYERLVAAAREMFTERGGAATLDDIARRAKVGPGTLYRHFPSREALLGAVYREDVEALAARAEELAETLPPQEALTSWLRYHLDFVAQRRGLIEAIKGMMAADEEALVLCRGTLRRSIERLLDQAQAAGTIRSDVVAIEVLRLVHGVVLASESAPEGAERLLSIVIDGLRPR